MQIYHPIFWVGVGAISLFGLSACSSNSLSVGPNSTSDCQSGAVQQCFVNQGQSSGGAVTCGYGAKTCSAGKWGECVITSTVTKHPAYALKSLGAQTACTGDVCDPLCQSFLNDYTSGIPDAGGGVLVSDAGILLSSSGSITTDGGTTGSGTCTSLAVAPPNPTITFNSPAQSTLSQLFTATLSPANCATAGFIWSLDKYDTAQIDSNGNLTTIPVAGPLKVTVFSSTGQSANTTANVLVNVTNAAGAPAGVTAASFTGATTPDSTLIILYPYNNTIFPIGLPAPIPQWQATDTATAAQVTLTYPATGTPIYTYAQIFPEPTTQVVPATSTEVVPAITGERAILNPTAWHDFELTVQHNRSSATSVVTDGTDTGLITIQRLVGAQLRSSKTLNVRFAYDQLRGMIYYNSYNTNVVHNQTDTFYWNGNSSGAFGAATLGISPGAANPSLIAGYPSADTSGCRVCHSLSANGTVLITSMGLGYQYPTAPFYPNEQMYNPLNMPSNGIGTNLLPSATFGWPALSYTGHYIFTDVGHNGTYPTLNNAAVAGSNSALYDLTSGTCGGTQSGGLCSQTCNGVCSQPTPTGGQACAPPETCTGTCVTSMPSGGSCAGGTCNGTCAGSASGSTCSGGCTGTCAAPGNNQACSGSCDWGCTWNATTTGATCTASGDQCTGKCSAPANGSVCPAGTSCSGTCVQPASGGTCPSGFTCTGSCTQTSTLSSDSTACAGTCGGTCVVSTTMAAGSGGMACGNSTNVSANCTGTNAMCETSASQSSGACNGSYPYCLGNCSESVTNLSCPSGFNCTGTCTTGTTLSSNSTTCAGTCGGTCVTSTTLAAGSGGMACASGSNITANCTGANAMCETSTSQSSGTCSGGYPYCLGSCSESVTNQTCPGGYNCTGTCSTGVVLGSNSTTCAGNCVGNCQYSTALGVGAPGVACANATNVAATCTGTNAVCENSASQTTGTCSNGSYPLCNGTCSESVTNQSCPAGFNCTGTCTTGSGLGGDSTSCVGTCTGTCQTSTNLPSGSAGVACASGTNISANCTGTNAMCETSSSQTTGTCSGSYPYCLGTCSESVTNQSCPGGYSCTGTCSSSTSLGNNSTTCAGNCVGTCQTSSTVSTGAAGVSCSSGTNISANCSGTSAMCENSASQSSGTCNSGTPYCVGTCSESVTNTSCPGGFNCTGTCTGTSTLGSDSTSCAGTCSGQCVTTIASGATGVPCTGNCSGTGAICEEAATQSSGACPSSQPNCIGSCSAPITSSTCSGQCTGTCKSNYVNNTACPSGYQCTGGNCTVNVSSTPVTCTTGGWQCTATCKGNATGAACGPSGSGTCYGTCRYASSGNPCNNGSFPNCTGTCSKAAPSAACPTGYTCTGTVSNGKCMTGNCQLAVTNTACFDNTYSCTGGGATCSGTNTTTGLSCTNGGYTCDTGGTCAGPGNSGACPASQPTCSGSGSCIEVGMTGTCDATDNGVCNGYCQNTSVTNTACPGGYLCTGTCGTTSASPGASCSAGGSNCNGYCAGNANNSSCPSNYLCTGAGGNSASCTVYGFNGTCNSSDNGTCKSGSTCSTSGSITNATCAGNCTGTCSSTSAASCSSGGYNCNGNCANYSYGNACSSGTQCVATGGNTATCTINQSSFNGTCNSGNGGTCLSGGSCVTSSSMTNGTCAGNCTGTCSDANDVTCNNGGYNCNGNCANYSYGNACSSGYLCVPTGANSATCNISQSSFTGTCNSSNNGTCKAGSTCSSGNTVTNAACSGTCTGTCASSNLATCNAAGENCNGSCSNYSNGNSCSSGYLCAPSTSYTAACNLTDSNYNATCNTSNGGTCLSGSTCSSGSAVNNASCAGQCTGTCSNANDVSCTSAGYNCNGNCANYSSGNACSSGYLCVPTGANNATCSIAQSSFNGTCNSGNGGTCQSGSTCSSGSAVNNASCSGQCTGTCSSSNASSCSSAGYNCNGQCANYSYGNACNSGYLCVPTGANSATCSFTESSYSGTCNASDGGTCKSGSTCTTATNVNNGSCSGSCSGPGATCQSTGSYSGSCSGSCTGSCWVNGNWGACPAAEPTCGGDGSSTQCNTWNAGVTTCDATHNGTCSGTCTTNMTNGTCNGNCTGSCGTTSGSGTCNGTCTGTCTQTLSSGGSCSGTCTGQCGAPINGTCSGSCSGTCGTAAAGGGATSCTGSYTPSLVTTTGFQASMPTFAPPNDSAIAFNFNSSDQKSVAIATFDGTASISSPTVLYNPASVTAPGTGTGTWPAFLPPPSERTFGDLVFQREITYNTQDFGGTRATCGPNPAWCNPSQMGNVGATDEIWWVNASGAAKPVRMNALNGCNPDANSASPSYPCSSYLPVGTNLHGNGSTTSDPLLPTGYSAANYYDNVYNYEPTVLPVTLGGYSWVIFTSRRMYGNIATVDPYWSDPREWNLQANPTPKKLWVSAVEQTPSSGADPSHPAFYLPGQELMGGNARAYFVLEQCVPYASSLGGASAANTCLSDADCCALPVATPPSSSGSSTVSSSCSDYAIVTSQSSLMVNGRIDSYNYLAGPYGGSNVGNAGNVVVGTGITVNGGAVLNGTKVTNSPQTLAIPPVPSDAKNLPLGSGSPGTMNINIASDSITLSPGDYVIANLNCNYPGAINVSPQGPVTIYVTGGMNLGCNFNLNGTPSNFTFIVESSATINDNSNGNGGLYGNIYAPTSTINLDSQVYGFVVGNNVTVNSVAAVHRDTSETCAPSTSGTSNAAVKCELVASTVTSGNPQRYCVQQATGCQAAGADCSTDADCCAGKCASGVCSTYTLPPSTTTGYVEGDYSIPPFSANCPTGTMAVWRFFNWEAITQNGTRIDFYAQTSKTTSNWQPTPPLLIGSSSNENGTLWVASGTGIGQCADAGTCTNLQTVDTLLTNAGVAGQANLQIIAKMYPDASGAYTPTLIKTNLMFDCEPNE